MKLWAITILLLVSVGSGCVIVPSEVKKQIRTECSVADADLREWGSLTEGQKRHVMQAHRRGWYVLRYSVLGDELPPDLAEEVPSE